MRWDAMFVLASIALVGIGCGWLNVPSAFIATGGMCFIVWVVATLVKAVK